MLRETEEGQAHLRIAPELYLKRLIVGGFPRVFEINRNFRNEGISTKHNPEFTMLEFYWSYADYRDLMTLTEQMLAEAAQTALGSLDAPFGDHTISFQAPFRRLSLRDAAMKWGLDFAVIGEAKLKKLSLKLAASGITVDDFDATILALRKWSSSELMDAGFQADKGYLKFSPEAHESNFKEFAKVRE